MSDSDDQYEVPSGGHNEESNKVEVSVTEIITENELDAESKDKGEEPEQDENITQQMKLLAVIDQNQENKTPPRPTDKGSTSIIGKLRKDDFRTSLRFNIRPQLRQRGRLGPRGNLDSHTTQYTARYCSGCNTGETPPSQREIGDRHGVPGGGPDTEKIPQILR